MRVGSTTLHLLGVDSATAHLLHRLSRVKERVLAVLRAAALSVRYIC